MSLDALFALMAFGAGGGPRTDRSRPPEPGPPPVLVFPRIQKSVLSNGLPVLFVERHDVPVVVVEILVRTGAVADPAGRAGLASFTADMLVEGAGARNALELADAIDHLGAELVTQTDWDDTTVRLYVPVARLAAALELLADVVLRPKLPAEELERLRKLGLTELLHGRDQPRVLASAAYQRALFGNAHRFGIGIDGTLDTVRNTTLDDVRSFYRRHFVPRNTVAIVVGDVTLREIVPELEKALGSWSGSPVAGASLARVPQVREREIVLVDKPGAPQSELRCVRLGLARSTPDYHAVEVMNTILGGAFTSRLNLNLREEHGYTYGAGSFFAMRREPGPFIAASAVQTEVTAQALVEMLKELGRIREPVSPEELERAKRYLALGYPTRFQTTRQVANQLGELVVYELPEDFFTTYVHRIQAVTAEDVLRVARAHVDPDRTLVVVVGDRARVEPGLRALDLGPVRHVHVDELLGRASGDR